MGYGLGVFLLAVGWILVLAGVLVIVLTAVQMNRGRASRSVATTTHADGSQTTTEQQQRNDPPPAV